MQHFLRVVLLISFRSEFPQPLLQASSVTFGAVKEKNEVKELRKSMYVGILVVALPFLALGGNAPTEPTLSLDGRVLE